VDRAAGDLTGDARKALSDSIVLAEQCSSEIRDIAFRHPERLSAPDYFHKVVKVGDSEQVKMVGQLPVGFHCLEIVQPVNRGTVVFHFPPSEL